MARIHVGVGLSRDSDSRAAAQEAVREALKQAGFDELFAFTPPFHSHRGIRT